MQKKTMKKSLVAGLSAVMLLSSGAPISAQAATWKQNNTGWWYQEDNGSYPANQWKAINGNWYWFDANGYMATGWRNIKGSWYYLSNSGAMVTGWQAIGGSWYYFDASGAMASDRWIGNYYVETSGAMAINKWIGDYYVDGSGHWTIKKQPEQWIQSGNRWWYRHSDGGYTRNGWEFINGKWYYFDGSGWMITGWQKTGNNWYYLGGSGAMVTSQWIGDYYVGSDGVMATNTWIGSYYVDENGKWKTDAKCENHKWIEKMETIHHEAETKEIEHPEESHQELVKEAWTETIDHPEESHQELVKEEWTEVINHEPESHYEIDGDGCWNWSVSVNPDGTNYKQERVFLKPDSKICGPEGLDFEVPKWEQRYYNICNFCGQDVTGNETAHDKNHLLNDEPGGWHSEYRLVYVGTETYHFDAHLVETKEAWTETITHAPEYKTIVDKEAWTETVNHPAEYKTVVDKEAWVETIVLKPAWDEEVSYMVCSICGERQK